MKKKALLIITFCIAMFAVFATIVVVLFNSVSKNPIDQISCTYLRHDCPDIESEYGNIIYIGRNVLHKVQKEGSTIKTPYTIETETDCVTVFVTLTKSGDGWNAVSYEVIEVKPNER